MTTELAVPQIPPQLRRLARESGVSPKVYLQDLMREHGTQAEAAIVLGVNERTVGRWLRAVGLTVRRERAA